MKKLEKLKLSDAKIMEVNEMKAIVGGQVIDDFCRNTGTSSGFYGDIADVVCEGKCPSQTVTGNKDKQVCEKTKTTIGDNSATICICI